MDHADLHVPATAAAAVARLRDENDIVLLHSLVDAVAFPNAWQNLRDAGIVPIFLDIILCTTQRYKPPSLPSWVLPLQGLYHSVVGILRTDGGGIRVPANSNVYKTMQKDAPAICERIYADKSILCTSEEHSEFARSVFIMWAEVMWYSNIQSELKAAHAAELATCCWVFTTATVVRTKAAGVLQKLLVEPPPTKTELDLMIASAGSYEKLVNTSKVALQDAEAIDGDLERNMGILPILLEAAQTELSRQYAKLKLHHDVLAALRRQLSQPNVSESFWRVVEYSGMILVRIVYEEKSPADELADLIEHKSLIPVLGCVFVRCAQNSKESPQWSTLVTLLKHAFTCKNSTCPVHVTPGYMSALHNHLSRRWWPTLKKLQGSSQSQLQSEWLSLGHTVGLVVQTEQERHGRPGDEFDGCWWVECVREYDSLRVCSGCKKAKYCRPECQTRDWKEHKKLCKNVYLK